MNKKYLLRGGFVLASIHVFIALILSILYFSGLGDPHGESVWAFFGLAVLDFPAAALLESVSFLKNGMEGIIPLIVAGTIQWFIIGSIVGGIYGKIKNRN